MQENKNNGKIMEISKELKDILDVIKNGYKNALGIKLGWKQATYILAMKIKKANLKFNFP